MKKQEYGCYPTSKLVVLYCGFFFTTSFFTSVFLVTVLLVVSIFGGVVSVAGLAVSVFTVVSLVLFMDDDESTFAESAEPPDFFPPQAANEKEIAIAKREILNVFFMML